MRRRYAFAVLLAVLAMAVPGSLALAAAPQTISMSGQASVVGSQRTPQLIMKIQAADASGWRLEVTLNPTAVRSRGDDDENENLTVDLSGTFTLGTTQQPVATGAAAGWLSDANVGDLKLTDANSATSLDMTFTVTPDGSVTAQVQGQWPALPAPQPVPQPPQPASPPAAQPPPTSPGAQPPAAPSAPPEQPASHFFWYLSRTAAMAAYALLFINVCLGLSLKSHHLDWLLARWRASDLHQFTALLAMALVGLHVFALLGDSYFHFTIAQLLLPVNEPYRPLWTALGIIAFYLALAVVFSCYIREQIGRRAWRAVHYTAFALFVLTLMHSIRAGTDTAFPWAQWLYIATGTIVTCLCLMRLTSGTSKEEKVTATAIITTRRPDPSSLGF